MSIHVDLGFTTLDQEVQNQPLEIQGEIPHWLNGTLIRNGAAKFEVGRENYNHWFDGLAMLHRFAFYNGQITYTNRFLQGKTYTQAKKKGRITYPEFSTLPRATRPYKVYLNASGKFTDNASVNVAQINGHCIALTETPPRVEFDPHTLNTIGRFNYQDKLVGHLTTVHPHYDYKNRQTINYITRFSLTSSYNIYSIMEGTTKRQVIASIPVKQPSYMHSFGMTENYVILTQFPLVIDPIRLLRTGGPFAKNLFWKPQLGTRFMVVNKNNGKVVAEIETDPFFAFHHVNCFEIQGNIIVDLNAYKDPSIIKALYLDNLRSPNITVPTPQLHRYHLNLAENKVTREILSQDFVEFPRLNYRKDNTQDYQYFYGLRDHNSNGFPSKLIKFDIKNKSATHWQVPDNYPGEPVFVPRPQATKDDDGLVLAMVLDIIKGKTYLLILDAQSFTEVARAYLPFAVPFGSHGQYFD